MSERCKKHNCFIPSAGCPHCIKEQDLQHEINLLKFAEMDYKLKIEKLEKQNSDLSFSISEHDQFKNLNTHEINALRGFCIGSVYVHDSLKKWQECNAYKPDKSKDNLIKQLSRINAEQIKMIGILNADMSPKNWERIKREIEKIHGITAGVMNNRDLGEWEVKIDNAK